jgi:hypothetical protein
MPIYRQILRQRHKRAYKNYEKTFRSVPSIGKFYEINFDDISLRTYTLFIFVILCGVPLGLNILSMRSLLLNKLSTDLFFDEIC